MFNEELKKFALEYEIHENTKALEIVNNIKNKREKIKQKQKLIEDLKYESDLIEQDMINNIRVNLNNSSYNLFGYISASMFTEAICYFNKRVNDKEKKKEYKKSFNFISNKIKEEILKNNNEFKLKDITNYFFETAFEFEYKYKNHIIRIDIPIYSSAYIKNYEDLLYGYRLYIKTSTNSYELKFWDLNYQTFADSLEKYINNLEVKQDENKWRNIR